MLDSSKRLNVQQDNELEDDLVFFFLILYYLHLFNGVSRSQVQIYFYLVVNIKLKESRINGNIRNVFLSLWTTARTIHACYTSLLYFKARCVYEFFEMFGWFEIWTSQNQWPQQITICDCLWMNNLCVWCKKNTDCTRFYKPSGFPCLYIVS